MTKLLEQALRQVEQRPEGEQNAAAGALLDYVKHMHNMQLTDAQLAGDAPPQGRSQPQAHLSRRGPRAYRKASGLDMPVVGRAILVF